MRTCRARAPPARDAGSNWLYGPRRPVRQRQSSLVSKMPWCYVPALATRAAGLRMCARKATVVALCREVAQHPRLPRARVAPRGFEMAL